MIKKHPQTRAERLRLRRRDKFDLERLDNVSRRAQFEALEQKEALDDLRKQVLQTEEEERASS